MVDFEGKVLEYKLNAMRDRLAGGGSASYDATVVRIDSPPERRGATLTIYHDPSPPQGSPWRKTGHTLRFSIREDDLEQQILFDGAVENLRDVS